MSVRSIKEAEAAKLQADVTDNTPIEFRIGRKKYKVRRLTNYVAHKMSKLIAAGQLRVEKAENGETMQILELNRKLVPQCISLMLLSRSWKVMLFHWFLWRKLHWCYTQEDYAGLISNILDNNQESSFFFRNMASLQANNILMIQMTKASTNSILQKHVSEQSTTQSSPSTAK